ncbi:MAG: beta-phosphoglucomutase, partial [Planctomycetota bacterium]|nr:beta-phosphoglucomutase [Planctomycetota bacterium]
PPHCVVIEDAAAGIAAARHAGMRAVGVGDPQCLQGADLIVPDIASLEVAAILRLIALPSQ